MRVVRPYVSKCYQLEEAKGRERLVQEHSKKIQQQREAEAAAAKFSQASLNTGNQQHDVEDDENERRNRSESLRKQRAAVGQVKRLAYTYIDG